MELLLLSIALLAIGIGFCFLVHHTYKTDQKVWKILLFCSNACLFIFAAVVFATRALGLQ